MGYLDNLIGRYKRIRSIKDLENTYTGTYALVGLGGHCISNLLPVVHHLQLPLKYICCTSETKAALVSKRYTASIGTTSLQQILDDNTVDALFVAANPQAHFDIARKVMEAGKALFIEKPPCQDLERLDILIDTAKSCNARSVVVGLQRRFAPATRILQKRLKGEAGHHYHYRYLTGLYPEGDALLDLFIHPLDYATFLFGEAKLKTAEIIKKNGGQTLLLIVEHSDTTGILELSTDYSWHGAKEQLSVVTYRGLYTLDNMERLCLSPRSSALFGIPLEKVVGGNRSIVELYGTNGFVPTLGNNQIVSQGFFSEIKTFADMVEKRHTGSSRDFGFESLRNTYALMADIVAATRKQ